MPCNMAEYCVNSPSNAGDNQLCSICKLSPEGSDLTVNCWEPTTQARKTNNRKHPVLEKERLQKKRDDHWKKVRDKQNSDPIRKRVAAQAALAEKTTEKNIIRSTRNSGRVNKDGDHVAQGCITLDTKHQSGRENPVIWLSELAKVGEDSKRASTLFGALVIRNKFNVGTVVLAESDFARLIKCLNPKGNNE